MGPAAPVVNRIRNQYLMELLIKLPLDMKKIEGYKRIIGLISISPGGKTFKGVTMIADVMLIDAVMSWVKRYSFCGNQRMLLSWPDGFSASAVSISRELLWQIKFPADLTTRIFWPTVRDVYD